MKNKNILIVGLGVSGIACIKGLSELGANLYVYDESKQSAEKLKELEAWISGVGHMAGVNPYSEDPKGDDFRAFSHHINIPGDMVEFVCCGGKLPEET